MHTFKRAFLILPALLLASPADAQSPLEKGLGATGFFVAMNNRISQSVPHLHVHVVPRQKKDGLRGFFWPRIKYENPAQMSATRDRIAAAMPRDVG